jgi:hypothetical protein
MHSLVVAITIAIVTWLVAVALSRVLRKRLTY